ncbi:hypothetical protein C0389_06910, partial [bacterium]|nr:hypothetical protein [bacterium]
LLWAHKYDEPPIGKVEKIKVENGKLLFKPKFATKEEYEFADTIFKLYKGGYLSAFSVGFDPKEWANKESKDGTFTGREYFKQELLELSGVPVPCNQEALQMRSMQEVIRKTYGLDKPIEITIPEKTPNVIETKIIDKDKKGIDDLSIKIKVDTTSIDEAIDKTKELGKHIEKVIIEPVQFKNMQELNEVMTIWKSGRVLSEKNRLTIEGCIEQLKNSMKALKSLLELTNQAEEPNTEEPKNIAIDIEKLIQESKSLLNRVNKKS